MEKSKRPVYHFTAKKGRCGDPNGLLYYKGVYHQFFQNLTNFSGPYIYNFFWGHAVSCDLVHWEELEPAVLPDEGKSAFSGGGLVDYENLSGLKEGDEDPMLLFWTEVRAENAETVAFRMSYSQDGGKTFKVHPKKLLEIPHDEVKIWMDRDPMVFYHKETNKFILIFYAEYYAKSKMPSFVFMSSSNGLDWTYESETEGMFECPDLFTLPVEGCDERKWVLTDAPGEYMVGEFDGHKFIPCQEKTANQRNSPDYAPQTWKKGDEIIQTGMFIRPELPGEEWIQNMTLPVRLGLRKRDGVYQLTRKPINLPKELYFSAENIMTDDIKKLNLKNLDVCEVDIVTDWHQWTMLWIELFQTNANVEFIRNGIGVPGNFLKLSYCEKLELKIFCDKNCMEVFADDGFFYFATSENMEREDFDIKTFGNRNVRIDSIKIYKIKP